MVKTDAVFVKTVIWKRLMRRKLERQQKSPASDPTRRGILSRLDAKDSLIESAGAVKVGDCQHDVMQSTDLFFIGFISLDKNETYQRF